MKGFRFTNQMTIKAKLRKLSYLYSMFHILEYTKVFLENESSSMCGSRGGRGSGPYPHPLENHKKL